MINAKLAADSGLPEITIPLPASRQSLEDAIERLIGFLDASDPDPDLEPSTGCQGPAYGTIAAMDEAEPDTDDEPSLGSIGSNFPCMMSQDSWAAGRADDAEEQCEDEGSESDWEQECEDEGADIDDGGPGATGNHVWDGMRATIVGCVHIGVTASTAIKGHRDPQPNWGHVNVIGGRSA